MQTNNQQVKRTRKKEIQPLCWERVSWTCHGVFWSAELFPQFVHIIRVNLVIQGATKPLSLRMVEHRCHRVRHVDHTTCFCSHHEQEAVCCLQNQVLQFLQGTQRCSKSSNTRVSLTTVQTPLESIQVTHSLMCSGQGWSTNSKVLIYSLFHGWRKPSCKTQTLIHQDPKDPSASMHVLTEKLNMLKAGMLLVIH